jgi:hypothetical protein
MSYNVAICIPPISVDDSTAWECLDATIEAKGDVPPVLRDLYNQLTATYPCICDLADDEVDNGVWSDGPLWNNFGHRAAVIGMGYSRIEDALPFVVSKANSLGLTVFDWGGSSIYRP